MNGSGLKGKFAYDTKVIQGMRSFRVLCVLVEQPTGAIEVITNTECLQEKIDYYLNAYDDHFCLKNNPSVRIVDYMVY